MTDWMPHKDITDKIIGAAIKVHKYLGSGFYESIYEKSLLIELENQGLKVQKQKPIQVFYYSNPVGNYLIDMVVEDTVIIELKAVKAISEEHVTQTINYLAAAKLKVGLVLNFGKDRVEVRRVVN